MEPALWVRQPSEIAVTPVAATSRARSKVMPPEASVRETPRQSLDALFHVGDAHVVEHDPLGTRLERALALAHALDLDLHRQAGKALRAATTA